MMKIKSILFPFFSAVCIQPAAAQDTVRKIKIPVSQSNSVNQAARELKKSLSQDEDDEKMARKYEALAKQLSAKGEYAKAEEYLKKAKALYAKLNKRQQAASASRSIGKVQESQNKTDDAISSYEAASEIATDKEAEQVNSYDAARLRNKNPEVQDIYINSNIGILEKQGKKEEVAEAYQQKAMNSIRL
ncbi:MAG TPA: tetratricopeptide repeat protein, partial [Flavobacterium sp.]|nr:tetratricopeptide repeat protein [Flavobacterium sp.]